MGFALVLDAGESVLVSVTMTVFGESVAVGVSVIMEVRTWVVAPVGAVSIRVTGLSEDPADSEETCALTSDNTFAPTRSTRVKV